VHTRRYVEALGHLRLYEDSTHQLEHPEQSRCALMRKYIMEADAATGHVAIDAPAGSQISLDGAFVGTAPLAALDVTPGKHELVAATPGGSTRASVEPAAGVTEIAHLQPIAPPSAPPPATIASPTRDPQIDHSPASTTTRDVLGWTALGVGAVGIGAGVGFLVDANSKANAFNALKAANPLGCVNASSSTCTQVNALKDEHDRSAALESVGFVVGGVALAGAAAIWLVWPHPRGTSTAWIAPDVSRGTLGVTAGGSFF
jgi:hypothetical protein